MNQEKIGLFIKELRNAQNMTQADLAEKLNVTDRAVSKWERGKGLPDISLLEDLSKIFNVSILEILKGERLEKETIKESNILDMLKYAKEDKKNFISKIVNIVCLFIIILTSLSLGIKNIKSIYYQNKVYSVIGEYDLSGNYQLITNNIDLIKKHQGVFNDTEYDAILKLIDKFEESMNYELDEETSCRRKFKISELSLYANKQEITFTRNDIEEILVILLKYDSSIFMELDYIEYYKDAFDFYSLSHIDQEVLLYDFNTRDESNPVYLLRQSIKNKYDIINTLTDIIVRVGDIHE